MHDTLLMLQRHHIDLDEIHNSKWSILCPHLSHHIRVVYYVTLNFSILFWSETNVFANQTKDKDHIRYKLKVWMLEVSIHPAGKLSFTFLNHQEEPSTVVDVLFTHYSPLSGLAMLSTASELKK